MSLKAPTGCCGVSLLLWSREKQFFMCPCGQTKINERGQPAGKARFAFSKGHGRGRPKGSVRRAFEDM